MMERSPLMQALRLLTLGPDLVRLAFWIAAMLLSCFEVSFILVQHSDNSNEEFDM
jgi:hypothetical protein